MRAFFVYALFVYYQDFIRLLQPDRPSCGACNLPRIFYDLIRSEEGITDAKVVKAWKDKLALRAKKLLALGREAPVKLYLSLRRPTEASLPFIRGLYASSC